MLGSKIGGQSSSGTMSGPAEPRTVKVRFVKDEGGPGKHGIHLDHQEIGAISILKMRLTEDVAPSERFAPRFEILARTAQRTIDPGDPLSIEIYLTGAGGWDAAKLSYVFPKGFLEKDPADQAGRRAVGQGRMTISIEQITLPTGGSAVVVSAKDSFRSPIDEAGGVLMFNRGYFSAIRQGEFPDMLPQIAGEFNVGGHAPIMIDTRVAAATPPGSYSIRFVLTYTKDEKAYTSSYDLPLHIRSFWERRRWQVALATAVFFTAVTGVVALGPLWVWIWAHL